MSWHLLKQIFENQWPMLEKTYMINQAIQNFGYENFLLDKFLFRIDQVAKSVQIPVNQLAPSDAVLWVNTKAIDFKSEFWD